MKKTKVLRSIVQERWEGSVIRVGGDSFEALLTKGSFAIGPDERAEFDLLEVSEEDRDLLIEGARFYWTVGCRDDESGQRRRFSEIRFQRLPPFSDDERNRARASAEEAALLLGFTGVTGAPRAGERSHAGCNRTFSWVPILKRAIDH